MFKKYIQTELILCDRYGKCYFEKNATLLKFVPESEGPMPYEIPLSCLISLLNFPKLQTPWTAETLEEYSELHQIGFNIHRLKNKRASLSPNFPG